MEILVEIIDLRKSFDGVTVINSLSLTVNKGEGIALMGSSGRGKTTLLRLIAGLEKPDGGSVRVYGKIAYMFQEPRLLPWKSVIDNVRAVLPKDKQMLAGKYIDAVGLSDAAKKLPRELSGGMAQRASFARFLAFSEAADADVLLLDEPFSALDGDTAKIMIDILLKASREKTVIAVTHDMRQAERLGRIVYI